jgi:hypothetical protein
MFQHTCDENKWVFINVRVEYKYDMNLHSVICLKQRNTKHQILYLAEGLSFIALC